MAKKRELYSNDIHPNAGAKVSICLKNSQTGAEVRKDGIWNGTHWLLVNKRTGGTCSIPTGQEMIGWHE